MPWSMFATSLQIIFALVLLYLHLYNFVNFSYIFHFYLILCTTSWYNALVLFRITSFVSRIVSYNVLILPTLQLYSYSMLFSFPWDWCSKFFFFGFFQSIFLPVYFLSSLQPCSQNYILRYSLPSIFYPYSIIFAFYILCLLDVLLLVCFILTRYSAPSLFYPYLIFFAIFLLSLLDNLRLLSFMLTRCPSPCVFYPYSIFFAFYLLCLLDVLLLVCFILTRYSSPSIFYAY